MRLLCLGRCLGAVPSYSYRLSAANTRDVVKGMEQKPRWKRRQSVPELSRNTMTMTDAVVIDVPGYRWRASCTISRYVKMVNRNTTSSTYMDAGSTTLLGAYRDATVWNGRKNSIMGIMLKHEH